jgi:hypothetical protein
MRSSNADAGTLSVTVRTVLES